MEFEAWPKISRYTGLNVVISEKIDGTNACINIDQDGKMQNCQSRTRIIDRHNDNFGFANWAWDNQERIENLLGPGRHFGEWAGPGIQNNPLNLTERYFLLFNTYRWYYKLNLYEDHGNIKSVPLLYTGLFTEGIVEKTMRELKEAREASKQKPEGIIIYWPGSRSYEKLTYEHTQGKWAKGI